MLLCLIECKFRSPNKRWLFFPEPHEPDFRTFSQHPIHVMDVFSAYTMESKHIWQLGAELELGHTGELKRYHGDILRLIEQVRAAGFSSAATGSGRIPAGTVLTRPVRNTRDT